MSDPTISWGSEGPRRAPEAVSRDDLAEVRAQYDELRKELEDRWSDLEGSVAEELDDIIEGLGGGELTKFGDHLLSRVDEAMQALVERAHEQSLESIRTELALLGAALAQPAPPPADQPDELEEPGPDLHELADRVVQDTTSAVRLDLAVLRAALTTALEQVTQRDDNQRSLLRTEVRRVLDRATSDTLAAVRADICSLQDSLRASAAEARTKEAEALVALRAESRSALEGAMREVMGELREEVVAASASLGALEHAVAAQAVGLAALEDRHVAERKELQEAVGQALLDDLRRREAGQNRAADELQATLSGFGTMLSGGLDAAARAQRAQADAINRDLRGRVVDLGSVLGEKVISAVDAAVNRRLRPLEATLQVQAAEREAAHRATDERIEQLWSTVRELIGDFADVLAALQQRESPEQSTPRGGATGGT